MDTNFRDFNQRCRFDLVFPLRPMIAMHTLGLPEFERLVVKARSLAVEWNRRNFNLCRCREGLLEEMTSVDTLRRVTPIVTLEDAGEPSVAGLEGCGKDFRLCRYVKANRL
jgi:hypothetical protein